MPPCFSGIRRSGGSPARRRWCGVPAVDDRSCPEHLGNSALPGNRGPKTGLCRRLNGSALRAGTRNRYRPLATGSVHGEHTLPFAAMSAHHEGVVFGNLAGDRDRFAGKPARRALHRLPGAIVHRCQDAGNSDCMRERLVVEGGLVRNRYVQRRPTSRSRSGPAPSMRCGSSPECTCCPVEAFIPLVRI